jgi:hypothetical protein
LQVKKTLIVGVPGRGTCVVLSSECSDGSFTKTPIATDSSKLTGVKLAWGKTIHFRNLEFITDPFDNLSLSTEGNDSGAIFVGMAHSGSPSLHAILEESTGEDDLASSEAGSSSFPISWGCNVVTPTIPIVTTSPSKGTPVPLTTPTVPLQTIVPQLDTRLLSE